MFVIALLCLLQTGCESTGRTPETDRAIMDFYAGNYTGAQRILAPLSQKTDEDYVLNNLRLGSVALADYDNDLAEKAFLRAYEVMNSTGVNDGGRGAAAAVVHEKFKIWKGEPYERAMCNFYLGTLYYIKADYNNARAAFENALFKLREYSDSDKDDAYKDVESDFVGGLIMLGKCWQKLGNEDKARDIFARAQQLNPQIRALATPDLQAQANVLLIVDFGDGPRKVTEHDSSIVTFVPKPDQAPPLPPVQLAVDGRGMDIRGTNMAPTDLVVTAHDRKWQDIDTIRLAKSAVGTGLMTAGAIRGATARKEGQAWTGAGLMAAGALLKASGGADLRHWEMLPRATYIIPLRLPPGKHNLTVHFGGQLAQSLNGLVAPPQGEATYYVRVFRTPRAPVSFQ
ncbi:MAG: hypothetical protein ABSH20_00940 [Tepidisphaeraceae bacterium]|jgi:tetratricopeptide (TPR) repeat protein